MKAATFVIAHKEISTMLGSATFWFSTAATCILAIVTAILLSSVLPVQSAERAARMVEALLLSTPILAAAVSCRLLAHQRSDRTLETLLSAPISDAQIICGKFIASSFVCGLGCTAIAVMLVALASMAGIRVADPSEITLLAVGLLAMLPAVMAWCACGLFFSLIVRQESGAMVEFATGMADTRPVFAFLSATAFLLFAAVRELESRTWLAAKNP